MSVIKLNSNDEFVIAHQKIVRNISYETVAHEILLRMFMGNTTQYFLDNPNEYVEHLGSLISKTARGIQKLVLEQNIVNVMVNFNENQLLVPGFLGELEKFYELGLEPIHLSIDVTCVERTFSDELLEVIVEIKKKGHPIVIGGFGGLPCDFDYIVETRPAMVKLCRKMVDKASKNKHAMGVLRNVVGFLNNSGTKVVVEGVETEGHLKAASQCGADFLQGFYFDSASEVVKINDESNFDYRSVVSGKLGKIESCIDC